MAVPRTPPWQNSWRIEWPLSEGDMMALENAVALILIATVDFFNLISTGDRWIPAIAIINVCMAICWRYKQSSLLSEWLTLLAMYSPSGWPLCKRSGLTLIEVSQYVYLSYQAFSLPRFITMLIFFAIWCNSLEFYWRWVKVCLPVSLSLVPLAKGQ